MSRRAQDQADRERITRAALRSLRDQLAGDLDRVPRTDLPELVATAMAIGRVAEHAVNQGGFDPPGPVGR